LIAYLSMMMFQGGVAFFMMLYLALYAALLAKGELQERNHASYMTCLSGVNR